MDEHTTHICPLEKAGALDTGFRKWFQNPERIMKPYVKPGMSILDLGCGPGFFALPVAQLLNSSGEVVAADLQQGMLEIIAGKIKNSTLESTIRLHKCGETAIGVKGKFNLIVAFWMVHEVPDQLRLFRELVSLLAEDGKIFIIEPKFHVTGKKFQGMVDTLMSTGLKVEGRPHVFMSRAVLLTGDR
jgi:ubiquinone/menaquinone biosynthesis C-methylase UbiE